MLPPEQLPFSSLLLWRTELELIVVVGSESVCLYGSNLNGLEGKKNKSTPFLSLQREKTDGRH